MVAISAPSAITLAMSIPVLKPPLAIKGMSGAMFLTCNKESTVGIPQSVKLGATSRWIHFSARYISTRLQEVPPAPATSKAVTPA